MIKLSGIQKSYKSGGGELIIFGGLDYQFKRGCFTSVLGESGSGKSTLLAILGGMDSDFGGEILFDGRPILDYDRYRRENVSFIFQDLNLIAHLNLTENIISGLPNNIPNKKKRALDLLERVGLLDHADKLPRNLSGGERQRVAVARALARNTDVLLCDEAASSLDSETKTEILELIKTVFAGKTILYITHDADLAKKYSDEIVEVKNRGLEIISAADSADNKGSKDDPAPSVLAVAAAPDISPKNGSFRCRFIQNLLKQRATIFGASYLMIIVSAILLFGMGAIKGTERQIDRYLYNSRNVKSVIVRVKTPMSESGFKLNTEDYNKEFGETILDYSVGAPFMVGVKIGERDFGFPGYVRSVKDGGFKERESYIITGKSPESESEILLSKNFALSILLETNVAATKDMPEEQMNERYFTEIKRLNNLSPDQILEEIQALGASFIAASEYSADRQFEGKWQIVGLIDDTTNFATVPAEYAHYYDETVYWTNLTRRYSLNGERTEIVVNHNFYVADSQYIEFAKKIHLGVDAKKHQYVEFLIKEEDLDYRNRFYTSLINFKNIFIGEDPIIKERNEYYGEMHGYKIAIFGAVSVLAIFAVVSLYNGVKVAAEKNRLNIGIYKSLGYTNADILRMFLAEGFVITIYVAGFAVLIWLALDSFLNPYLVRAFDPNELIPKGRVRYLDLHLLLGIVVLTASFISFSIIKETRKKNITDFLK